jgi:hypothetical protein
VEGQYNHEQRLVQTNKRRHALLDVLLDCLFLQYRVWFLPAACCLLVLLLRSAGAAGISPSRL